MPYNASNVPLARKLRKDMTPWERKLWYCFLSKYTVRFQRQKAIGNYIADIYCAAAKLVVELDGGGHYDPDAIRKDAIRTDDLRKQGIAVIRFCNLDVDNRFYEVCSVIDDAVKKRYSRGTPPV